MMFMADKPLKSLRVTVVYMATVLLTACGGASGSSGSVTTYVVSVIAGTGGSVSPSSAMVDAGGTTVLTVTPSSGYAISAVTGCGGTLSGNAYTTGPINANCSVTANFVNQYTVTATAGPGGTITPSSVTLNAGATARFIVKADENGYAATVTGCDGTLLGRTYTTGAITADCAVTTSSFVPAFTWVGGSNTVSGYDTGYGVYGTEGVAANTNVPGARQYAVSWAGPSGTLWLFGGYGWGSFGTGSLNDLWEYSPSNGEWTWVSGSGAPYSNGIYGTEGVAAASNVPPSRSDAVGWTGTGGNLWLFGGMGYIPGNEGDFNDLWKYSPSSGEWTWVSGSDTTNARGVYGTKGIAAASNVPGARQDASAWTDASGNLWLFGGESQTGDHNTLWKYSPSSGEWTWISGSDTANATGVYGTKGVAGASNVPGARFDAVSWVGAGGNLWLFGGFGFDSTDTFGRLNDLWEYSPASNDWTWISGANTVGAKGVYGTEGVAASENMPGARNNANGWVDAAGNLWLFGGYGLDSTGSDAIFNDLWKFSPSSDEWTWVAGSNTGAASGVYGTEGVAAVSNVPGGRYGAVSWIDSSGNLWLFGGDGVDSMGNSGDLNDLWEYPTE